MAVTTWYGQSHRRILLQISSSFEIFWAILFLWLVGDKKPHFSPAFLFFFLVVFDEQRKSRDTHTASTLWRWRCQLCGREWRLARCFSGSLSLSLQKVHPPFFPSHPKKRKKEEEAPLFKAKLEIKNLKMFLETDHLFNLIINFIIKINVTKHVYLNMNLKVR